VLNSPGAGTTVKLSPHNVDVGPLDFSNTVTDQLIMGLEKDLSNESDLKLQFLYDGLDNKRFVSYGFPAWFRANTYEGRALTEGGVKVQLFNGTVVGSIDAYLQDRTELAGLNAVTERTRSSGEEIEIRWLATTNISFTFTGNMQHTEVLGPDTGDYYIPAYVVCGANLTCRLNSWGGAYLLPGRADNYALTTIPNGVASVHGSYITDAHEWGRLGLTGRSELRVADLGHGGARHRLSRICTLVDASVFYQRGPYEVGHQPLERALLHAEHRSDLRERLRHPWVGQEWRLTLKRKF
jgi:iron complex outermembrane receptor protein